MISSSDFRTGLTLEIDNGVWQIVDFQHVKPGKGAAFVRTKIKNVQTGAVVERTFNPNEKLPAAHVETRAMQYLYEADGMYTFMDNETYDQIELTKEQLGSALNFLKENMDISLQSFKGNIIGITLPPPDHQRALHPQCADLRYGAGLLHQHRPPPAGHRLRGRCAHRSEAFQ